MADDKTKRSASDRALIALSETYEVAYWSKKLKVTPAKLRYAVKKVGHSARKVEAYIKLQKHRAADKSRISLGEAYEVRYWSKKFKITPAKLKSAVAAAGHSARKVAAYLRAQKAAKKKKAGKTSKTKTSKTKTSKSTTPKTAASSKKTARTTAARARKAA